MRMNGGRRIGTRLLLWSLVLLIAIPPGGIAAQDQVPGGQAVFRQEELDQMLAPIALYPDDLLVQVLMAATYPLEVVQAARWVAANPQLKGDQLATALEQQNWDPSVKSLCNFPTVLEMMNSRLEWMQMMGDAFLGQQDQVMNTVQQLRQRAQAQGNLRATNERRVVMEQGLIAIEPAVPQVVYVPVYDPMVVYGTWWWPAYRPFYYRPPGVVIAGAVIGLAVAVGVAWGYAWGNFNWHQHRVVVNVTRNVYINKHIDRNRYIGYAPKGGGPGTWSHDPIHRRGIAYRSPAVAQQHGRGPLPGDDKRRDFRGFDHRPGSSAPPAQQRVAAPPPRGSTQPPARQPASPQAVKPQPVPAPTQVKTEPPRQPVFAPQQPRVAPASAPVTPRPARPVVSPAPAGTQSPTAFGVTGNNTQVRQASSRGHGSLGSAPAKPQASGVRPAAPSGPKGNGNRGNSHGGR